jgi:hypothetical protein
MMVLKDEVSLLFDGWSKQMRKITITALFIVTLGGLCFAQGEKPLVSFEQLFPSSKQRQMGLHKLTEKEREALRSHIESLLIEIAKLGKKSGVKVYAGVGGGHWIQKNVESGKYIILEDGSIWEIDPLEKIDSMLWLPISEITVIESSSGSPGFNYLLINTDDGGEAHAKYKGKQ